MYAYSDSIIWPNFTGYCVNQSGIYLDNIPDYTGTDWGPRPLERALFAGNITATFLPIETLIGMPTFTYEEYDNGAVVFAEMNLTTLSADIASKAPTDFSFLHVSETQSKLLIATTDPLGVLYSNGTRRTLPTINGGIVLTHRIAYLNNSLDWTVYVGTTYDKVYGNLRYVTMVAGIVGMVIVLVGVGALVFSIWFCVSRVLHNPNSYSLFSDIQPGAGVVMDV
jgi:sensor histidine kinase YesM